MHDVRKIDVMEGILDENDHIAEHINEHLAAHGILAVNEMGAPGVGKTTTLKNIFKHLPAKIIIQLSGIPLDFLKKSA